MVASRAYNTPTNPMRKLALQFNTAADVFTKVNPDAAGTPLTLTSATGVSGSNGTVTLAFRAGYTPTIKLTVFVWLYDNVTPTKAGWIRYGPQALGGTSPHVYELNVDSNYCSAAFSIEPHTPFLIMCDTSITGDVYTDALAHSSNANSATGYAGLGVG